MSFGMEQVKLTAQEACGCVLFCLVKDFFQRFELAFSSLVCVFFVAGMMRDANPPPYRDSRKLPPACICVVRVRVCSILGTRGPLASRVGRSFAAVLPRVR